MGNPSFPYILYLFQVIATHFWHPVNYNILHGFECIGGCMAINATCDKNTKHFYLLYNEMISKI